MIYSQFMANSDNHAALSSTRGLGRAVRDARRRARLTQTQLAERAGTAQATVSNVERGVSAISVDTLFRLLAALELELVLRPRVARDLQSVWEDDDG